MMAFVTLAFVVTATQARHTDPTCLCPVFSTVNDWDVSFAIGFIAEFAFGCFMWFPDFVSKYQFS
jgi:hypothetical protein